MGLEWHRATTGGRLKLFGVSAVLVFSRVWFHARQPKSPHQRASGFMPHDSEKTLMRFRLETPVSPATTENESWRPSGGNARICRRESR
jgi:hypothetical protein